MKTVELDGSWFSGTGLSSGDVREVRPGVYLVKLGWLMFTSPWDDAVWFAERGLDILDFRIRAVRLIANWRGFFTGLQTTYGRPGAPDAEAVTLPRRLSEASSELELTRAIELAKGERITSLELSTWVPHVKLTSDFGRQVAICPRDNFGNAKRWVLNDGFAVCGFACDQDGHLRRCTSSRIIWCMYVARSQVLPWSIAIHAAYPKSWKAKVRELLMAHNRASKQSNCSGIGCLPMGLLLRVVGVLCELEFVPIHPYRCPVSFRRDTTRLCSRSANRRS